MERTIQDKLCTALQAFGHRTAVLYRGKSVTYEELDRASGRVSSLLRSRNAAKGTHIGILMEDRAEFIAAVIGILKAGCVFVPLDPSLPDKRLARMVQLADLEAVLAEAATYDRALSISGERPDVRVWNRSDAEGEEPAYERAAFPDDPIYLYFTSGSTGEPKGVLGKNESLLDFINWEIGEFSVQEGVRVSQLTSPGFDASLRDIFVPLCAGGVICIPDSRETILDSARLVRWLEQAAVSLVHCTPSLFSLLNQKERSGSSLPDLQYVLMSGEAIAPRELKSWYAVFGDRIQLVNLYGPTETTMVKTFYRIGMKDTSAASISIGRAMPGSRVHILDEALRPCPDGAVGELYIESPYMSLGYYNNSAMNKERFLLNPADGKTLYRTGDLGRLLPDGNLEYRGRKDGQIKIRGNRIELGEIESELLQYPGIRKGVAVFHRGNEALDGHSFGASCIRCGLSASYPGTRIGEDGVCNVCKDYDGFKEQAEEYFRPLAELQAKLDRGRAERTGPYDCILLYSGGKDSTYVLYKLLEMGARVLAYTFDNGYISEAAFRNIDRVVAELKVDHIVGTAKDMPRIFLDGLNEDCSVCIGCFKALRILSTRLACEKGIPYVVSGLSRGQMFDLYLYDIMRQGARTVEEIEGRLMDQHLLYYSKSDYVTRSLNPEERVNKDMLQQVELVDFYRYSGVGKKDILNELKTNSPAWQNPEDTGFCSSNCLINDAGIYVQRKKKRYDNYTFPNSWEVRLGLLGLEESRLELESDVDYARVKAILDELGYEEKEEAEGSGHKRQFLAAYYVTDEPVSADGLREHLTQRLPDYMVPSYLVPMDKLPLNANGKLDYRALPDPTVSLKKKTVPPRDETEMKLCEIWSEILGTDAISIDDRFLEFGVHSLNIMTLIARVYQEFQVEIPLEEVFNNATIEHMASYIRAQEAKSSRRIGAVAGGSVTPLSAAQKRLFTSIQLEDTGTGYHLTTAFRITGSLDTERLEGAFRQLLERHESLRTSFEWSGGEPVQRVHDTVFFDLRIHSLDGRDLDQAIRELVRPFDIQKAPLFRAHLIRLDGGGHVLVLDAHHIIADGKSMLLLQRDLASLYAGRELPALPLRYRDYAEWQHSGEFRSMVEEQEPYWMNSFSGYAPGRGIPTDYPRKAVRTFAGDRVEWSVDSALCRRLYELAAEEKTTLFMLLITCYKVLYAKYSAREDITVGTPVEGRRYAELGNMVGMFANTLAVRSYPSGGKTFRHYLAEMKSAMIGAYQNQDYPYDQLVKSLGLHRSVEGAALFDTVFSMLNYEDYYVEIDGVAFEYYPGKTTAEVYDIRVELVESPEGFSGSFKYSSELFKRETIETFAGDYTRILAAVADHADVRINEIAIRQEPEAAGEDRFAGVRFGF